MISAVVIFFVLRGQKRAALSGVEMTDLSSSGSAMDVVASARRGEHIQPLPRSATSGMEYAQLSFSSGMSADLDHESASQSSKQSEPEIYDPTVAQTSAEAVREVEADEVNGPVAIPDVVAQAQTQLPQFAPEVDEMNATEEVPASQTSLFWN